MINIGIICPSDIAYRRFLPALLSVQHVKYIGVACATKDELRIHNEDEGIIKKIQSNQEILANKMLSDFGGKIYNSYQSILEDDNIQAVYLPLPPALHFHWAKESMKYNKHVLIEKPFTISKNDTLNLLEIAKSKNLAVHENYMFVFHDQIKKIKELIVSEIGDIKLIKTSFGFPIRGKNDFRYNSSLGGGSLFDAGGYTIKLSYHLLGPNISINAANLVYNDVYNVDIFGAGHISNEDGVVSQVSFGMDNEYKCDLEIWGSKGIIQTNRVYTAPADFKPTIYLNKNGNTESFLLDEDNHFVKSIQYFIECIFDKEVRYKNYIEIMDQAALVEEFISKHLSERR